MIINAVGTKITSFLSMIGSGYIIHNIIAHGPSKLDNIYNRIMLGLSIFDMIGSFAQFLSTWPIPAGAFVDGGPDIGDCYYGNVGTLTTCELQGFLIQSFAVAGPIYNAALCLYFVLYIQYNWSEQRLRRIEPFMYGAALYPMITAIPCWKFGLFNPVGAFCWIGGYPLRCLGDEDVTCLRGESTLLIRPLATLLPVALSFVTIITTMSSLCLFVLKQDFRTASLRPEARGSYLQTKSVFAQACRYVGAYLFVWLPSMAYTIDSSRNDYRNVGLELFVFLVVPLQGFLNAIIYSKARIFDFSCLWCQRLFCRIWKGADWSSNESLSDDSSVDDVSTTIVGETYIASVGNNLDCET